MLKNIVVFSKESKRNFVFSHINFIFGYAKSGKTTILLKISDILSGKDKHHLVNGTQSMPNDFNVIFLSSSDGISSHLKLSSKSLLRKTIEENKYSDSFSSSCEMIEKGVEMARGELEGQIQSILPGSRVAISDADNPMTFLIDNMSISFDNSSSSQEKERLFSLVNRLTSLTKIPTIVVIDDFNNDFDEEMTISFLEEIEKSSAYFILSSKKSLSQSFLKEDCSLFAVRDSELTMIPDLKKLVLDSIVGMPEYTSFEEYMTGAGYVSTSGIADFFLEQIQNDERNNIIRILTSKNPIISTKVDQARVTICPRSKEEEEVYRKIFEILGIASSDKQ
jgi:hypothetical protein